MNDIIKKIEEEQLKAEAPQFRVGDTVKVHNRIKEGNRERVQIFEGIVIKKQGGSSRETFTVRKSSMASAWKRHGRCILPMWRRSKWSAAARSDVRNCTICVTASAKPPRSKRSCAERKRSGLLCERSSLFFILQEFFHGSG